MEVPSVDITIEVNVMGELLRFVHYQKSIEITRTCANHDVGVLADKWGTAGTFAHTFPDLGV